MLKVYNTLGREQQEFTELEQGKVNFYHCGPTVYWVQHIGNMRAVVMADLIVRSLKYLGYEVKLVRNYTDVGHLTSDADQGEDKMDKAAKREGKDPQEIADKYIEVYDADIKALNVLEPDQKPRASEYVKQMISLTEKLLENGFAYATPLAIYFDVSKFPHYTKLSGQKLEENESGAGKGDVTDPAKRNQADFALWFFKAGNHATALQTWPSPFNSPEVENGEGLPGWHIECSAMAIELLGETIDMHMGGVEHISVHHTNEIAQSEAATGKPFANYWLHNEHLTVDGGKMSKSEGTSITLGDIKENGFDPIVLRYFFLNSHYRSKQNFTWEALEGAQNAYNRLTKQINNLQQEGMEAGGVLENYRQRFRQALEEDFNIPQALAVVWELLKEESSPQDKLATIYDFDRVLGLQLEQSKSQAQYPQELDVQVQQLLDERQQARAEKNWTKSDLIRDKLQNEYGVLVEDTEDGQKATVIS